MRADTYDAGVKLVGSVCDLGRCVIEAAAAALHLLVFGYGEPPEQLDNQRAPTFGALSLMRIHHGTGVATA